MASALLGTAQRCGQALVQDATPAAHLPIITAARVCAMLWTVTFTTLVVLGHFLSTLHRVTVYQRLTTGGAAVFVNGFLATQTVLVVSGYLLGCRCCQLLLHAGQPPSGKLVTRVAMVRLWRLMPVCAFAALISAATAHVSTATGACHISSAVLAAAQLGTLVAVEHQCIAWVWVVQTLALFAILLPILLLLANKGPSPNFRRNAIILSLAVALLSETPNYFYPGRAMPTFGLWHLPRIVAWPHYHAEPWLRVGTCFLGAFGALVQHLPKHGNLLAPHRPTVTIATPLARLTLATSCAVVIALAFGDWSTPFRKLPKSARFGFLALHRLLFSAGTLGVITLHHAFPAKLQGYINAIWGHRVALMLSRVSYSTMALCPFAAYATVAVLGGQEDAPLAWIVLLCTISLLTSVAVGVLGYLMVQYPCQAGGIAQRLQHDWTPLALFVTLRARLSLPGYAPLQRHERYSDSDSEESDEDDSDEAETESDTDTESEVDDSRRLLGAGIGAEETKAGVDDDSDEATDSDETDSDDTDSDDDSDDESTAGSVADVDEVQVVVNPLHSARSFGAWPSAKRDAEGQGSASDTDDDESSGDESWSSWSSAGSDDSDSEDGIRLTREDRHVLRSSGTDVAELSMEVVEAVQAETQPSLDLIINEAVSRVEAIGGSDALVRRVIAIAMEVSAAGEVDTGEV